MISWLVFSLCALMLLLFGVSWMAARAIERRYPPTGRFVDVDGVRVHLVEWGQPDPLRPTLLFVHGASSNHREFMLAMGHGIQEQLHRDQHSLFVDRPGQGASERRSGDHSPRVQADRLMRAAKACGAQRCIVIGHSWGGSVVAQMAVHHQECVTGALFAAPATHPWQGGGWGGVDWYYGLTCLPVIGWLFARLMAMPVGWFQIEAGVNNVFDPEAPTPGYAQGLGARLVLRPAAFQANASDVFRLRPFVTREAASYARIACPVHILTGDEDAVVWPHVHSDGLERDIKGARKHVIKGGGHMPHHTQAPLMLNLIASMIAGEQAAKRRLN